MDFLTVKNLLCGAVGATCGTIAGVLGGWDMALEALVVCMAVDFISGFIVAGVFHNSPKTETGRTASHASLKGLSRKCMMLLFVLIGFELERVTGSGFIRESIIYGFIANELLSITENAGLMGLPLPAAITNAVEVLKKKAEKKGDQ